MEHLDPWDRTYTIRGTVFSTVEFNHNIIFKSHEDGNNVKGTCVCIATLGSFAGDRFSVVAFLHNSVIGRAPVTE